LATWTCWRRRTPAERGVRQGAPFSTAVAVREGGVDKTVVVSST